MAEENPLYKRFIDISLTQSEAKNLLGNDKKSKEVCAILVEILDNNKITTADRKVGALLQSTALSFQKTQINKEKYLNLIVDYILTGKISLIPRLDLAIQFLKKLKTDDELDKAALDEHIGVGINVTTEDITKAVKDLLASRADILKEQRYKVDQTTWRNEIVKQLKFPNMKELFDIFKAELEAVLGPKTEEDKKPAAKPEKPKKADPAAKKTTEEVKPKFRIEDLVARDMNESVNSKETNEWKIKNFGPGVLTRFPPEPNGYLHLGHCRAINFNFSLAKSSGGGCYLRFDDTNPEKENQDFIDSIKGNIEWLGFKPKAITASSNHFDYLYECAVKLIKKGKAFVCGQTKEQMKESRENSTPSPFRDTSVEENLRLFKNMKLGLYKEGQYSLRAKIDYKSPNTTLKDPVIYRIRYTPHPHSGDKWCIYPLYDFTHPICDSLEGITHSCCTLEFEIRRDLYYWVLNELDIYRPYVWEYARLNISYNIMSKRKIQELVDKKIVSGWDDPRLMTIDGMKRRGYTARGLLQFINDLGVSRTSNDSIVPMHTLEDAIRNDLDETAVRTLAVLEPIMGRITNIKDGEVKVLNVPDFPRDPKSKTHQIKGLNKVYVERSDVLHRAHKDFFGLAPGTLCGLKYYGVFRCTKVNRDAQGNYIDFEIEYVHDGSDKTQKPKTFLNWISADESQECEVRQYDLLFNEEFPAKVSDYLSTINPESNVVLRNSRMDKNLKLNILDRYQFERQGFYAVDYDSDCKSNKIVWNRVVKLIEKDRKQAMIKVLADVAALDAKEAK